jgi:hypothetical protein
LFAEQSDGPGQGRFLDEGLPPNGFENRVFFEELASAGDQHQQKFG